MEVIIDLRGAEEEVTVNDMDGQEVFRRKLYDLASEEDMGAFLDAVKVDRFVEVREIG